MNSAWSSATTSKALFALLVIFLLNGCGELFFYPQKQWLRTPADVGVNYEDIYVTSRDQIKLHGWLLKAEQPKGIVFFLHGNGENISTHLASVYWLPEQGYDVLLMDYRGYGKSEGAPDFPQVFWDVDAFYQCLRDYAGARQLPVTILGQSLGGAIASYYFGQLPKEQVIYQGLVLDSIFSGQRDIAKDTVRRHILTWPLQFLVPLLISGQYDPKDYVAHISPVPILFFHSPDDPVIPYAQGQTVFQHAGQPKYWVTSHGPHIATFFIPANRNILLKFLADPNHNPTD